MSLAKTESSSQSEPNAALQRAAAYAKIGVPLAVVVTALVAGYVLGPATAVLVLAGGALLGVIATFWASIRTLLGETPLSGADAYALGAPRAEEEQKQAVLRALKDLEFERSVGKISEEDYRALVARYRTEAKRLLRVLDADVQPNRERVEALVAKRLRREGLLGEAAPGESAAEETAEDSPSEQDAQGKRDAQPKNKRAGGGKAGARAKKKAAPAETAKAAETDDTAAVEAPAEQAPTAAPTTRTCASCGTNNDADAVFCKKCGTRQGLPSAEETARGDAEVAKALDDEAGA